MLHEAAPRDAPQDLARPERSAVLQVESRWAETPNRHSLSPSRKLWWRCVPGAFRGMIDCYEWATNAVATNAVALLIGDREQPGKWSFRSNGAIRLE